MAARSGSTFEHDGQLPVRKSLGSVERAQLGRPIVTELEPRLGATPTVAAVVSDQAVAQGLGGQGLKLGRERGSDRETALVEHVLAMAADQLPPQLLGEIVRRHDLRWRPLEHHQWFGACLFGLTFVDHVEIEQSADHPVAPALGGLGLSPWMVAGRCFRQAGQERRFRGGEFVQRFVEVVEGRGGHTIGADAEIDLVQIQLQDLVLGEGAFDAERQQRLLQLALEGQLVAQQKILGDLLGDGRRAHRTAIASHPPQIDEHGPSDAENVDSGVVVEVLVLSREERLDQALRHGVDRHEDALLMRVLRHQTTVPGVDPGHGRRLIIGELAIIRQVGTVAVQQVDQADRPGDADEGQAAERDRQDLHELTQR